MLQRAPRHWDIRGNALQCRGAAYLAVGLINVEWLIDAPSVRKQPQQRLLRRSNRTIFIALRIVHLEALATPILRIPLLPLFLPLLFFSFALIIPLFPFSFLFLFFFVLRFCLFCYVVGSRCVDLLVPLYLLSVVHSFFSLSTRLGEVGLLAIVIVVYSWYTCKYL